MSLPLSPARQNGGASRPTASPMKSSASGSAAGRSNSRKPFVVKTFPGGFQPGIDPTRLKEYLYEEDDERILGLSKQRFE